ncbi:MAG: hypothetical protein Q8891_17075 [Bacteroidota bacterium]|jgi:hypothetical protein|nr:hypothetical protein [Bacteroidota bacterium]
MKKLSLTCLVGILCLSLFISCNLIDNHDTSFKYRDSDHYYSMQAHFNVNKMRDVEDYMDDEIGSSSNMSFRNSEIDGKMALDDHTVFYIKKSPGRLEIKLDKDENSEHSYKKIKEMCQGLKHVVIQ